METEEQIFRDVTFSLDIPDDIYQQAIKEFRSQRLRYKMGGDMGIHFPKHSTDVSVYRHDPPLQIDPNL
jgi:hypothetical protein